MVYRIEMDGNNKVAVPYANYIKQNAPTFAFDTVADMNAAIQAGDVPAGAIMYCKQETPGGSAGDSELDPESTNWVQNSAITAAIKELDGNGTIKAAINPSASEIASFSDGAIWLEVPLPYLTFSSDSAFTLSVNTPGWNGTLEYSTDTSTWTTWDGSELSGNASQPIYLRGRNNTIITGNANTYKWSFTGKYVTGNIENLLDYQTVTNDQHPTMDSYCYNNMFRDCTSLVNAPSLPATTLAEGCYDSMFYNCTSLTTPPELPATTLTDSCYHNMFLNCTSLTTVPELPATTLANNCYQKMFQGCTSLTTPPELPATTLAEGCYQQMFQGCTSLVTAPELPATTLAEGCYQQMFQGCTSLVNPPQLPATTLPSKCYYSMFQNCISLKISSTQTGDYQYPYRIPTIDTGTDISGNALSNMFKYTGGTFKSTPAINITYYTDHEPV